MQFAENLERNPRETVPNADRGGNVRSWTYSLQSDGRGLRSRRRACGRLPSYEPRPEQAALADQVERSLATGEHLVAEAGTGVGKSLAYLIPALASGLRVVVATATKALQEQLLKNDVPIAAAALGRDVRVEVLKGRQNYLCRRQLSGFQPMLLAEGRDGRAWEAMRNGSAHRDRGSGRARGRAVRRALGRARRRRRSLLGRRCAFHGVCFAEAARDRASSADLVIANHALYFADLAGGGGVLPEHDAVVFDEAHRLEESAASWLGGGVSRAGLRRLALDLERACRERQETLPAARARAGRACRGAPARRRRSGSGRRRLREPPREEAVLLGEALAALALELTGHGEELDGLARRALQMAAQVEALLEPDEQERVVWAEPGAVAWAPVDVSTELRDRLWEDGPTAVLVSATLTAGEDARFVRRRLGLDRAREAVVGSPYDFGEQALLYLPQAMPDPRTDEFIGRAAAEIVSLLLLSEGRALVLTSSYRALDAYREQVRGRVPYDVLVQGEAPRERLLERFRDEVGSVLLATSTFWQGVDVPGESLSLLVIDKLPFSAPGDPLHEARCEAIERAGGDWFSDYALPTAMLQLRQGFGRLIRGHTDRGVVAILDPRLRTRAYGRAFLAALLAARSPKIQPPSLRSSASWSAFPLEWAPDGEEKPHPDAAEDRAGAACAHRQVRPRDDLGLRHRNLLYGIAGSGVGLLIVVVAFVVLSGGSKSNAADKIPALMKTATCSFKTVTASLPKGQPMHLPSLTKKFPWNTDPPSNGQHYPLWAVWGFYTEPVNPRQVVHNEEHGGVILWWGQGAAATVDQLRTFYNEEPTGSFGTPYAKLGSKVAITAWTGTRRELRAKRLLRPGSHRHLPALQRGDEGRLRSVPRCLSRPRPGRGSALGRRAGRRASVVGSGRPRRGGGIGQTRPA